MQKQSARRLGFGLAAMTMLAGCGVNPAASTGAANPNTPYPLCQADPYNTIYQNKRFTCDLEIQASPGNASIPVYTDCSSNDHVVKFLGRQNTYAGALDGQADLDQTTINGDAAINTEGLRGIEANMVQQFIDDIKAGNRTSPCSTPNARSYLNVGYNIPKNLFGNTVPQIG